MASVIITISDTDSDGGVNVKAEFDPALEDDETELTPAQAEGAFLIEVIQRRGSGQTLAEIASEMNDDEYGTLVLEDDDDNDEPPTVH